MWCVGGVTAAFRSDPLLKWFESTAADRQLAMRQVREKRFFYFIFFFFLYSKLFCTQMK